MDQLRPQLEQFVHLRLEKNSMGVQASKAAAMFVVEVVGHQFGQVGHVGALKTGKKCPAAIGVEAFRGQPRESRVFKTI